MRSNRNIIPGYLYIVEANNGLYKIGVSKTPKKRFRQIENASPIPVKLIHIIKCDDMYNAERIIHARCCIMRSHGEWFRLRKRSLEYILRVDDFEKDFK